MNRIDRLTAILLLLQGGKRTAAEIAERFEVSRRTIQRDIDALGEMGIPVAAELGTTGGYSLPSDYFLPPLALTLHEVLLLRLALSSLSQLNETPFKQERESLLAKVQTLLARHEGENLDQLQQTISVGVPSRPFPTPFLDKLVASAQNQQWLQVNYRSEKGINQRIILPLRLRTEVGLWYCEAFSLEHQAVRVFRVDRFLDLKPIPAPSQKAPASSIHYVDDTFPQIQIRLTERGVLKLERETYLIQMVQRGENGEGLLRVRFHHSQYEWLTNVILTLGTDAEVLAPPEFRQRFAQAAREIAQQYL
jgi:predicted DNA-binding transcriptional regulator YafY